MKRFVSYCWVALLLFIFAIILLPINPRLTKRQFQNVKCRAEILNIATGIEKYRATYQEYPSREIPALCKQLAGDNPQKLVLAAIKASSVNTNGELVDIWEMPYQIQFLQQTNFIIHSAGEDKIFGTADDIVFNSVSNGFVKP